MEIIVKSKKCLGADLFLFGLKGFSIERNLVSFDELKSMDCSKIFLSIDKNIFNDDLKKLEETLVLIDDFGLKGIMFYDLSILSISKRLGLVTPLIWNQNYLVTNYRTCNFYNKQGVSGAVISSEITLDEVLSICNNTKLDLFVNVFGYPMMAFSRRKLISSYFDYIGLSNDRDVNYMKERGKEYPIYENEFGTKILCDEVLNGIRYIDKLKDAGVKYVILDDFLIDDDVFVKVYDIFNKSLNSSNLIELERDINSMISTSTLFFDKKTIYKVKKND